MHHPNYSYLLVQILITIHSFRSNDPQAVCNSNDSRILNLRNIHCGLHFTSLATKNCRQDMFVHRATHFLGSARCLFRFFSSKADLFDVSLNSKLWPYPLKSCSCNDLTVKNVNETVTLSGWVDSIRIMKDSVFIVLRDGEGKIQTLFDSDKDGFCELLFSLDSWVSVKVDSPRKCRLH